MTTFAETSFVASLYLRADDGELAEVLASRELILISELVIFEFTSAAWFEVCLRKQDVLEGYSEQEVLSALAQFEIDLESGVWTVADLELKDVLQRGSRLSAEHTVSRGVRSFDVLHIASALSLGASEFLTFDRRQSAVAAIEGLETWPLR